MTISPDEVLLAAGWVDDAVPTGVSPHPVSNAIFRFADGIWRRIDLPLKTHGAYYGIAGVVFADAETAYAWGWSGEDRSILLRSTDRGISWADVSDELPGTTLVTDLRFSPSRVAWLVGGGLLSGVSVWSSDEDASHWKQIPGYFGFMRSAHRFVMRGDHVDLVYNVSMIQQLSPTVGDPQQIAPSAPDFIRYGVATMGDRAWLAGNYSEKAAIYSADVGEPFGESDVEGADDTFLQAIDVRGNIGVACGVRRRFPEPFCVHSEDSGATWKVSRVPGLDGYGVTHVVLASGSIGWAIASSTDGSGGVRWLTTIDGGRSWSEAPRLFEAPGRIEGLVHN